MGRRVFLINFVDFWNGFNPHDSFIMKILEQCYDVRIVEDPDYLFCSVFSNTCIFYDCTNILYSVENHCHNFNNYYYVIGF